MIRRRLQMAERFRKTRVKNSLAIFLFTDGALTFT